MVELYRIGVNEISFFCQFYLRNITDSSRYDFRYAPFPPSDLHIKGLQVSFPVYKRISTDQPIQIHVKNSNQTVLPF